jgi:hypothetical protein
VTTLAADPVLAVTAWPTNAHLIEDAARLGYLRSEWRTLDPTFGRGVWWRRWQPDELVACDVNPDLSPLGRSIDFADMRHRGGLWGFDDASFDAVTFDPPYKLNGTPTADVDARYGVHVYRSRADRHHLMRLGLVECARVVRPGGMVLAKCQNQVNGGKVRWQTDMLSEVAGGAGLEKVDELHMLAYRAQPEGTRQEHARRNHSTLLVFRRAAR